MDVDGLLWMSGYECGWVVKDEWMWMGMDG